MIRYDSDHDARQPAPPDLALHPRREEPLCGLHVGIVGEIGASLSPEQGAGRGEGDRADDKKGSGVKLRSYNFV